jgi:hypothetical protein
MNESERINRRRGAGDKSRERAFSINSVKRRLKYVKKLVELERKRTAAQ